MSAKLHVADTQQATWSKVDSLGRGRHHRCDTGRGATNERRVHRIRPSASVCIPMPSILHARLLHFFSRRRPPTKVVGLSIRWFLFLAGPVLFWPNVSVNVMAKTGPTDIDIGRSAPNFEGPVRKELACPHRPPYYRDGSLSYMMGHWEEIFVKEEKRDSTTILHMFWLLKVHNTYIFTVPKRSGS